MKIKKRQHNYPEKDYLTKKEYKAMRKRIKKLMEGGEDFKPKEDWSY